MEQKSTRVNGFIKTFTAVIVTVILMLAVKSATAHTVQYYTPSCFTQGSNVTVSVKVVYAAAGSYYHWQIRTAAGGSWVWLSNGNNTINGRTFSVSNASQASGTADYTAPLSINNVGSPAYTTQLDDVELRVIMTDALDPQYNAFPGTSAWGGEEFYNAYEAKYVRLRSKAVTENCYSNCAGNILVTNPASPSPALSEYFGGFEIGTGNQDDNFSIPGTYGATSKASTDITKWSSGAIGSTAKYRILSNADSANTSFTAFAPHSGNQMMVISNNSSNSTRLWYRTIAVSSASNFYTGQVTFKAWFAKVSSADVCMVMEVKGATTQNGTVASFSGNSANTTLTGAAGAWVQLSLTVTVPVATYKKLEFSIRNCNSSSNSVAVDDICLVEPAAGLLPVTLLPLQNSYADGVVHLSWATEQEINSNYFEVEHSTDGVNFSSIGKIYASGYSSKLTAYKFDDVKAAAGINYYRLRMVDKDGVFAYSNITSVKVTVKGFFVTGVYPSPFTDKLSISLSSENAGQAVIRLSDLTGRKVTSQAVTVNKGVTTVSLNNLGTLSAGMYVVEVSCGGNTYTQKIMK
jgi:Secretion system C-terminal sorting domain